ncbi:MAG TPA: hypothetical protein VIW69_20000, partial [Candidatus Elarobacter sp.]
MRTRPLFAAAALLATALSFTFAPLGAAPSGETAPSSPRKPAPKPAVSPSPGPDTDGVKFRAIGPATSGGRVPAVAGSDRDPALYYAGGAGGGVFKSTDGGVSWRPTFDREAVAPIGALAVSPRDPN